MAGSAADSQGSTRIFIRDDDVGALTPEFQRFFRLFADRGLPVSYQIIPEKFTTECADFLRAAQARNPGLVEFGQHGLRHEMVVRGKLEYYEFGPERSYDQQRQDIRAGRAILRERLGADAEVSVFTPPRHRFNRDTLRALDAEGLTILSASSYPSLKHQMAYRFGRALGLTNLFGGGISHHGGKRSDCSLFELSIAVAADDGGTPSGSVDNILGAVERARAQTHDFGVMFHHQAYQGPDREAHLEVLANRLARLAGVSFHTIGALRQRLAATMPG
jgi:hypothetical protein